MTSTYVEQILAATEVFSPSIEPDMGFQHPLSGPAAFHR